LDMVGPLDLVKLVQAFAATEICHYTFMERVSAQLQVRVQMASAGQAPPRSSPTFSQLVDVAEGFARLKFQDYSYFEMCAFQAESLLQSGGTGLSPPALARLCTACAKLKIHEVRMYEAVLAHASQHWYDYSAASLAEIGAAISPALPREPLQVKDAYTVMMGVIAADKDTLTLEGVALAARFMAEVDHKGEFMPELAFNLRSRLLEMRDDTRERYDVARVTEIFGRRMPEDNALFSCLCRHLHRHLAIFEPVDFVRFTRGLAAAQYRDDRVVHALAKWARKRSAEFSSHDWEAFVTSLGALKELRRTVSSRALFASQALR